MACGSFVTELTWTMLVRSKYFRLDQKVFLASTSKLVLDYQGNMLYIMVIGENCKGNLTYSVMATSYPRVCVVSHILLCDKSQLVFIKSPVETAWTVFMTKVSVPDFLTFSLRYHVSLHSTFWPPNANIFLLWNKIHSL